MDLQEALRMIGNPSIQSRTLSDSICSALQSLACNYTGEAKGEIFSAIGELETKEKTLTALERDAVKLILQDCYDKVREFNPQFASLQLWSLYTYLRNKGL